MKIQTQNHYNKILNDIPLESIRNWALVHLTVSQRKALFRSVLKKNGNFDKNKKCYLYDINGTFISEFESREDAGEQICILTWRDTVSVGYVSQCLRRKRPIYKKFWVTEEYPFNKEVYILKKE